VGGTGEGWEKPAEKGGRKERGGTRRGKGVKRNVEELEEREKN